jgi:hypothetical protein
MATKIDSSFCKSNLSSSELIPYHYATWLAIFCRIIY